MMNIFFLSLFRLHIGKEFQKVHTQLSSILLGLWQNTSHMCQPFTAQQRANGHGLNHT